MDISPLFVMCVRKLFPSLSFIFCPYAFVGHGRISNFQQSIFPFFILRLLNFISYLGKYSLLLSNDFLVLHCFIFHIKSLIYLEFILDKAGILTISGQHVGILAFTESIFIPQRREPFKSSPTVTRFLTVPSKTAVITKNTEPL